MPKIIYRKIALEWRNPRYSIYKRLEVIRKKRCMVHESMAKKATTTHVGEKIDFLKMRPTVYFAMVIVSFLPPLGIQIKRKRSGSLWFFLVVDFMAHELEWMLNFGLFFVVTEHNSGVSGSNVKKFR